MQELGVSASQGCCQTDYSSEDEDLGDSGPSSSSCKEKVPLPKGFAESLMNGGLKLPYSDKFPLPPAVPCHDGCGEAYHCRWVTQPLFFIFLFEACWTMTMAL